MKKIFTTAFLLLISLGVFSQGIEIVKHGETFKMKETARYVPGERLVEGIRIGEYYWLKYNNGSKHITNGTSNGQWGYELIDEWPIPMTTLEKYFDENKLDKAYLNKFTSENLNDIYGRYYNDYSFYGSWVQHNQYREPLQWGVNYYEPETNKHHPVWNNNGWRYPENKDFHQLFAMSKFNTNSSVLTARDIQTDLGAKEGDNELAFDIPAISPDGLQMNWFKTSINRYGFSMMPGGETKYQDIEMAPLLFKGAKFLTLDASLEVSDKLVYGPIKVMRTWVPALKEWHHIRLCRRLTPAELGYEIYYSESQQDIKKVAAGKDGVSTPPAPGYEVLAPGYLRGFYTQYFVADYNDNYSNNKELNFTVKDIIRFAKCVEDPTLVTPDCDCSQSPFYAHEHMYIGEEGDNILEASLGEDFTVTVTTNNPHNMKIGLFSNSTAGGKPTFIGRIDKGQVSATGRSRYTYNCNITKDKNEMQIRTGKYVILPYMSSFDSNIPSLVERRDSHIMDRLPVVLTQGARGTDTETTLLAHMTVAFNDRSRVFGKNEYKVYKEETFDVTLRQNGVDDANIAIGLFDINGSLIEQIDTSVRNGKYTCKVGVEAYEVYDDELYIIAPYEKDSEEMISRTDGQFFIDRLPLYVIDDVLPLARAGMKSENIEALATVHPNPVSDILNISVDAEIKTITIVNINGSPVKQVNGDNTQIDVSMLAAGIYFAKVETSKGTVSLRFSKK